LLHEEVNEKTFGVVAQVGKLTADEIKKAIEKILAELQAQAKGTGTPDIKHGKQSLKELSAQNAGLSSIELSDPNLRLLNRTMKQNGVDFAPVKAGKDKYMLFFKGRDADAITFAFNQYTKKVVKQAEKPSIRKLLSTMKEAAAQKNAERVKVKNKDKGMEL